MKKQVLILFVAIALIYSGLAGSMRKDSGTLLKKQAQVNCAECHSSLLGQAVMHYPAEDDCENCHMSNGNEHPQDGVTGFDLGDEMPALCFMCHEEPVKKIQHAPSEMGECLMCHSPHGSPNSSLLIMSPQSAVCAECHDMSMTEKPVKHQPVVDGACSACHDPHESEYTGLLKSEKPTLCFTCHENVKEEWELEKKHYPFEDDCAYCHETHSAEAEGLLMEKSPGLCYNCHSETQALIENSKVVHGVVTEGKACSNCHSPHASGQDQLLKGDKKEICLSCHSKTITSGERELSNVGRLLKMPTIVHEAINIDGCITCHNPHASQTQSLLTGAFPKDIYVDSAPENFELCFTCHDSELITADSTFTATNFRNGDQNLHYLHINGDKGRNCNVCHDMHASFNEHLIRDKVWFGNWEMPIGYNSKENGGSCNTGCHATKIYSR